MSKLIINNKQYAPKLILFDVDGTLIDDLHRYSSLGEKRYNAFKEFTSLEAADMWAKLTGVNPSDWSIDPKGPISKAARRDDLALAAGALYLCGYGWYDAKALAEKIYGAADLAQSRSYTPRLFDGAKEKLYELHEAGFMLGIATNGVTEITKELIRGLGLEALFSTVVGADLVESGKPAPDMIILACKNVGVNTQECIYVGDQETDMKAARATKTLLSLAVENRELSHGSPWEFIDSVKDIHIFSES